jgi:hypothetical protein
MMIWKVWKRVFCASVVATALVCMLPTRWEDSDEVPVFLFGGDTRAPKRQASTAREYDELGRVAREIHTVEPVDGGEPPRQVWRAWEYVVPARTDGTLDRILMTVWAGLELPVAVAEAGLGVRRVPRVWLAFLGWAIFGAAAAAFVAWRARRRYAATAPVVAWAVGALLTPVVVLPFYYQFRPYENVCRAREPR